ncbi:MAG: GFA family protein [Proteobacteria bacterium]|nr:GFA family protein [Pseudomonadota bacterium]
MEDSYTGTCACGAIRYSCAAEPAFSWNCHCRDCQRASGSAFCAVLYVPRTALTVHGEANWYEVLAESGRRVSRGFCPRCGSPMFIQAELVPELQGLWAASLDVPARFQPQVDVWVSRKQPWDCTSTALPKIGEAPNEDQFHALLAQAAGRH